jgi:hypothetical protein
MVNAIHSASRLASLSILLLLASRLSAQIGVQGQIHLPGLIGETETVPSPVLQNAWSAGIVYTIRNSGIRLEFIPGIGYMQTSGETDASLKVKGQGLTAGVDVRLYPMDLYGDCMCPTFSRKGDVFKKGFFWEGGAGYLYLNQNLGTEKSVGHGFFARVGAGIDIGLSRSITITPGLRMQYQHRLHHWGNGSTEMQHRPIWFLPFLQLMTYFDN